MDFHAQRVRRRALVTGAAALAVLGFTSDRAMAAVTAHVDNRTLDITGSAAADKLALSPDPATLRIDVGEDGTTDFSFDRTTFDAVAIATGGGADEVRIENAATPLRNVTVDGGAGNDTLIGGNGDETFAGGAGNDFVDGNIGHDVADLGAGKDVFEWDPGDGSDTVDGGAGDDTLAFNGSNIGEDLHLFADGAGGATLTRNVAAITMGLDNLEDVAVRTLGGADTLTVDDLAGTGVQRTEADLSATGGGGDGAADTVIADGTPQADHAQVSSPGGRLQVSGLGSDVFVAGGEATDTVEVAGQDGDDELDTGVGVSNPAKVLFDGGAGSDHAYYDGTAGDDTIGIARDGVAAVAAFAPGDVVLDNTAVEDLTVRGFGGADTLTGQNGIGALTRLTLDGGPGDDTLAGGDGADVLLGGSGNDHVDGNIGADDVQLGSGDDTFEWDPGDGSDHVDGQAGADTLAFNGSNIGEQIHVLPDGAGGATLTRNVAAIAMGFQSLEDVAVRTLGGADVVTVDDLDGTGVKRTEVDLGAADDGAPDTVVANGTENADAAEVSSPGGKLAVSGIGPDVVVANGQPTDVVEVAGNGGDDTVRTGVGVTGLAHVLFDGGAGTDHARYDGTAGDDTIGIARDGVAAVAAFAPGDVVLDNTAVEDLAVHGLAGNDTLTGQNGIGSLTTLTEDGGPGDDTLAGGDGADVLLGGSGNDHVDGNIGADEAQLGAGDDTFQWDPGDGSDHVDGQSGDDTLAFNGSNIGEEIALSPQGRGFRLFRNVGAITMNADNVEHAGVTARGGADILTVDDLAGTVVKSVDLDLSGTPGAGDAAADTLIENGSAGPDKVAVTRAGARVLTTGLGPLIGIAGSEPAADLLRVDTLDGDDDVTVASDVSDLIAPVVDLGPGE